MTIASRDACRGAHRRHRVAINVATRKPQRNDRNSTAIASVWRILMARFPTGV